MFLRAFALLSSLLLGGLTDYVVAPPSDTGTTGSYLPFTPWRETSDAKTNPSLTRLGKLDRVDSISFRCRSTVGHICSGVGTTPTAPHVLSVSQRHVGRRSCRICSFVTDLRRQLRTISTVRFSSGSHSGYWKPDARGVRREGGFHQTRWRLGRVPSECSIGHVVSACPRVDRGRLPTSDSRRGPLPYTSIPTSRRTQGA